MSSLTLSTCFYIIKSKFDHSVYVEWMNNFISIVNNFNLVIYTDESSLHHISSNAKITQNDKIKIIVKPIDQFYNYKYKEYWIKNHEKNHLLNLRIDWKVNMLWSEKIWFVNETIANHYFDTDFYGWCDIGYFRNGPCDTHIHNLIKSNWPNIEKVSMLDKTKIHYACVNNNDNEINNLIEIIKNKNHIGLPSNEIPPNQTSIAGGFFILYRDKIDFLCRTYNSKLQLYFDNNYLVKDDQIILVDCIFSNLNNFKLYKEINNYRDNWFMFQRILE